MLPEELSQSLDAGRHAAKLQGTATWATSNSWEIAGHGFATVSGRKP